MMRKGLAVMLTAVSAGVGFLGAEGWTLGPCPPAEPGRVCSLLTRASRAAFSPDGSLIACLEPSRVQVWDLSTGGLLWEEAAPLAVERDGLVLAGIQFTDLAISPDGRVLAVLTDGTLNEWDLRTGGELSTLLVSEDRNLIAISPDGAWLAVNAYLAGETFIWDRASREPVMVLPCTRGAVAFSPDGQWLLVGKADGTPELLGVGSWEPGRSLPPLPGLLVVAAFSPDGRLLALASWDSLVRVYDLSTGGLIHSLAGHREPVSAVAFSPDGRVLASGGRDELVIFWDLSTGEKVGQLDLWAALELDEGVSPAFAAAVRRAQWISDLAFSPKGGILATCGVGKSGLGWLQLWQLAGLW